MNLLPCPFCGGNNVGVIMPHASHDHEGRPNPVHWVAICTPDEDRVGCGASGTWMPTEEEAGAAWNKRDRKALTDAYRENQNMHCFTLKGRVLECLERQTGILRRALGIESPRPPRGA